MKQTRDVPATKCKIEFSKVLQSLYTAKSKIKSHIFIHTFSKSLCLDSSFKNSFQETFPVNVMNIKKNTPHALGPLTPSGTKRNIYVKKFTTFSCRLF